MTHAQRRIEDKLPAEPLKWPTPEAELEGCEVDTHADLYDALLTKARSLGYPSINAALDACAPFVSRGEEVAPQVPSGHWLPQRDPADETMLLSKVTRQYPQLAELMGREALLMRCVREALCVEADPEVAHALQYAFVRDVLAGAPAEQASKQVPTIDTPEFRKALDVWAQTDCDDKVATDSLVAYIESHFAGQPAAPVAATEQATIDTPEFRNLLTGIYGIDTSGENYKGLVAFINAARAPLATPADAGAGLTVKTWVERMGPGYVDGGADLPEETAMKAEIAELREALARLSTSAALVAATKQVKLAEALRWTLEWIDAVPSDVVLPAMPGFDRDYVNSLLDSSRPLATPADAGAGLMDCDAAFDNWYAAQCHQLTNEQVCRLIWQRGWQACARLSSGGKSEQP